MWIRRRRVTVCLRFWPDARIELDRHRLILRATFELNRGLSFREPQASVAGKYDSQFRISGVNRHRARAIQEFRRLGLARAVSQTQPGHDRLSLLVQDLKRKERFGCSRGGSGRR